MAIESAADLAGFFDADDFAVAATYTPQGGVAVVVNGIFDDQCAGVDVDAEVEVSSETPMFRCASADLPSNAQDGDRLVVNDMAYSVRPLQDDGRGTTVLMLEKV